MRQQSSNLRSDFFWGLKWAIGLACFCTLLAGIADLIDPAAVDVLPLVLVYFGSGILSGVVIGIFRRRLQGRWAGIALSIFAALPPMVGIGILAEGSPSRWDTYVWMLVIGMAVYAGVVGRVLIRYARGRRT